MAQETQPIHICKPLAPINMKNLLIFILLFLYKVLIGQNTHETIIGHWSCCSPETGYTEIIITDTLIDFLYEEAFGFPPFDYRYDNNGALLIFNSLNDYDTVLIKSIDENQMIMNWYNEIYTLTRLPQTVLTYYDFDCELKMNQLQFMDFLFEEFMARKIKHRHLCTPEIVSEIKKTPNFLDILDQEIQIDSSQSSAYFIGLDYKFLDTEIINKNDYKLIGINYNYDSTEALVIIDHVALCYDVYSANIYIDNDSVLNISLRQLCTPCTDQCLIRFYFNVAIQNYVINRIKFNDKEIY